MNKEKVFSFKNTLLMPFTKFDMKANLFVKEPILIKKWEQEKIYQKILKKNENNKKFIIHDGPPYANGNIHCGHMLNRFLKDFIIRLKMMQGYYTPFVFGWDTHGLPIENQLIKNGVNPKNNSVVSFRQKCKQYAIEQVNIQKEQIRRLGVIADVSHSYLTLDKEFEANQLEIFKKLALDGYIFRSFKPVFWSPTSETALAESEIEYHDIESDSIYVLFEIKKASKIKQKAFFIIWTTTPWTIPANLAVCLNEKFVYGLFETEKGNFIFLKEKASEFQQKFSFKKINIIAEFYGKDLENIIVKHPIYGRDSIVILGNHVTNTHGTGCVHTAPGHGLDDYNACLKYKIKPYCPVDSRGFLDKTTGIFSGLFYEDANKKIIEVLKNNGSLLKLEKIIHSYPHDWRTKKPIIFRATPQWFCSIEPIKAKILKEIKKINWFPNWGQLRIANMISEREDWCISRQRKWGVPIPIIFNEDNSPIIEEKVFDHIIKLVRENGSDIWYEKEAKELLPANYSNIHSPNGMFRKEMDIMDVWFDSGSSWMTLTKENYPADLYLEGNDQYRGWFNSSLIISNITTNQSSFKNCVTHGFVTNEKSEKMSKSQNNAIDPITIANQYGADILRLWATIIDYQEDSKFSENIIQQICEVYRKIRNTFKFLLGNLSDGDNQFYNPKNCVDQYEILDIFILNRLEKTKNLVIESFNKYDFNRGIKQIIHFIVNDLSQFYLNIAKDVLYCDFKDSLRRRQIQSVIYKTTYTLMCLLTPIIPFTMEEVNDNLPFHAAENPNLYDFPIYTEDFKKNLEIEKNFVKINELILKINKKLEEARNEKIIGSSQEAKVCLFLNDNELINFISQIKKKELLRMLIISEIDINIGPEDIKVFHSNGEKCKRCWNYFPITDLITFNNDKICQRCYDVVKKC